MLSAMIMLGSLRGKMAEQNRTEILFRLKLYSFSSFTTYEKHILVMIKQFSFQKQIQSYHQEVYFYAVE